MPGHELFLEIDNVEIYRYINQFKLTIFYEEWMKIFYDPREEFIRLKLRRWLVSQIVKK